MVLGQNRRDVRVVMLHTEQGYAALVGKVKRKARRVRVPLQIMGNECRRRIEHLE